MKNPGRIWKFRGVRRRGIGLMLLLLVLSALYLSGGMAKAEQSSQATQTSTYVFLPAESTIVKTGGIAGVHETYFAEGRFHLTVDTETGAASFSAVDTKLTAANGKDYAQGLGAVFNMAGLAGVQADDTTIQFAGKTADGTNSDVLLTLTFMDNLARLVGKITPPPNSADMFFWDLEAVAIRKYAGGMGEPNTPYLIETPEHMNAIGAEPNDWDKHFRLVADIDLRAYRGTAFNIIAPERNGTSGPYFTGLFDGAGHTISNFTYSPADANSVALFGNVRGRIENVSLIDPNIDSGSRNGIAPLVDWLNRGGNVSNCYAQGGVVRGKKWVGGLVAYNTGTITDCFTITAVDGQVQAGGLTGYNDGTITGCSSAGKVTGNTFTGGLVGWNDDIISDSRSTADVTGDSTAGGLIGRNNGAILNCSSTGHVTGVNDVAGLVGRNYGFVSKCRSSREVSGSLFVGGLAGFNHGSVTNCYSDANVLGDTQVGGLAGRHDEGTIGNCYSTGSVFGDSVVGGLVGWHSGEVFNCYSVGSVIGRLKVGGLAGAGLPEDIVWSFWDIETSGLSTSAGGIGKTTAEMQTTVTFLDAGWDFVGETANGTDDIWRILEGRDYPRLWWEAE